MMTGEPPGGRGAGDLRQAQGPQAGGRQALREQPPEPRAAAHLLRLWRALCVSVVVTARWW